MSSICALSASAVSAVVGDSATAALADAANINASRIRCGEDRMDWSPVMVATRCSKPSATLLAHPGVAACSASARGRSAWRLAGPALECVRKRADALIAEQPRDLRNRHVVLAQITAREITAQLVQ